MAEAWFVPVVYATLPAELAKALVDLKQPNNIAVEHLIRKGAAPAYGGGEARSAMRLTNFLANGIDGSTGNHVNGASRVRIAINDSDDLKYTHLGFRRKVGGSFVSSFAAMRRCGASSCDDYTPASVDSHGSWMSRIIIGSLEDGQDPAVTGTTDRLQRSGVISKAAADLYYYSDYGPPDYGARMPVMFGQAFLDNIDVLNMSNTYSLPTDCNRTHNPNPGDNEAMYDVVEAGVLPVKAIGNNGVNSTCNAVWPGMRRDGLAIAAINTPLTSTPYDSATTSGVSSTGDMQIRTLGTLDPPPASQKYAIADLSAPCGYSWWYRDPNNIGNNSINTYDPVGVGVEGCYTSNAAPAAAAAIAYLRSAFWSVGWGGNNARDLTVNALLMGDGYSWTTGGVSTKGFDKRSGAGRMKMHFPSSADLVAPWGWAVGAVDIASGQVKSFPVMDLLPKSTSITQLKLAMTFSEKNYDQSADVDTCIYNVCNGTNTLVAADTSYDIRSRIVLSGAQIGNKCLEHRLYGYNIPSGQTRRVYVAFYYHSGSTSNH